MMKRGRGRPPLSEKEKKMKQKSCDICSGAEFFKVFLPRFASHHLMIPPDFNKHYFSKCFNRTSKESLVLKDLFGKTWRVGVEETPKGVFIGRGWESFVDHYRLKAGEFFVFRFEDCYSLVVKVFGTNGCKKEEPEAAAVKIEPRS